MNNYFVSIIIPVFNNAKGLDRVLKAISLQDYPSSLYEVIVIDNGSQDNPRDIAMKFNAIFLEEKKYLGSPYSARNRGLEISKGDIISFLDTTSAPIKTWLSSAVQCFAKDYEVKLVGGAVKFLLHESDSIGKSYDSLFNIRMEESINQRQVAKTGNLFVRKEVFDEIGAFPEGLRSGGDVRWTKKATNNNFKLIYSENAKVLMLPRGFSPLVKKQFRVAKGQPTVWMEEKSFVINMVNRFILFWVPPHPGRLKDAIDKGGHLFLHKRFFRLFFLGYFLRWVTAAGIFVGIFRLWGGTNGK